jgi:hypothetical protein
MNGTGLQAAVSGFTVHYQAGDACGYNVNLLYTSEIRYYCQDQANDSDHRNWPTLVQPRQACHLVF